MDREELRCPICFKKYDSKEFVPKIIPICGHTLCSVCITNTLEKLSDDEPFICPFDKY